MTKRTYIGGPPRFSRPWWLQGARTLFWVAVVTILVWVYADTSFIREEAFDVTLVLEAGKADLKVLSDRRIQLGFEVRGNRTTLDRFKRDLTSHGAIVVYDVTEDYGPGEHTIATTKILRQGVGVERLGLTVTSVNEPTIRVRIDEVLERTLRVRMDYTGATLASPPEIEPAEVKVRVNATAWAKATAGGEEPVLSTRLLDLTNTPSGLRTEKVALVGELAGTPVDLAVRDVTVRYQIKERSGTDEILLPVYVQMRPEWQEDGTWERYVLKRKDPAEWSPRVTVRGPRKDLDRLRTSRIDAYIVLTEEDRKPVGSWLQRPVVVRFPSGLLVELTGPAPTVQFKLVEATASAAP
jgi:hypothetical protein